MITENDPRHGRRSGYLAGCREECCTEPNFRYQKRSKIRLQREGTQIVPAAPVVERIAWWAERGVSMSGITKAAGIGEGTIRELVSGERDLCLKGTRNAVLAVGWDDLPDRVLCAADLTRARIYSMMAAGHRLEWIIEQSGNRLPFSGRWRQQDRVTVATARVIQQVYAAAPLAGTSKITASKARNKGHLHPLGWDDPGVPAMPFGWAPAAEERRGVGRPEVVTGRVEDFDWLISHGTTPEQAAVRLGVRLDTFLDQRRRLEKKAS